MEHQLECACGNRLSCGSREVPKGGTLTCDRCGAMYAVTVTQLRESSR